MDKQIEIPLGSIDFDTLKTESDYERLAERLMPQVLETTAKETAEIAWTQLQKSLTGTGLEVTNSHSEKQKFIRDFVQDFVRTGGDDRDTIKRSVIEQIKAQKPR